MNFLFPFVEMEREKVMKGKSREINDPIAASVTRGEPPGKAATRKYRLDEKVEENISALRITVRDADRREVPTTAGREDSSILPRSYNDKGYRLAGAKHRDERREDEKRGEFLVLLIFVGHRDT